MIRLTTLGAIDLRDDQGRPVREVLAQPKRLALLIYLAIEGAERPVSREALIALFWPASNAARGRNALSQAVHHLRSALGAALIEGHGAVSVQLHAGRLWCDASVFTDAVARHNEALALDLYRGDFCAPLIADVPPPVAAWMERERGRLRELAAAARPARAPTASAAASGRARRLPRAIAAAAALILAATGGTWAWRARRAASVDPALLVVAPFRTAAADSSLQFLREGMLDLLAARLTSAAGLRAVDPRTVLGAAARRSRHAEEDLDHRSLLATARDLGAGRILLGSVVGRRDRFTLTAQLLDTRRGTTLGSATLEGTQDSLPHMVDALAGLVLVKGAGLATGTLTDLTTSSLPALLSYLDGRRAFRSARYDDATAAFRTALDHDSLFALAWLEWVRTSSWVADAEQRGPRDGAWRVRERLPEADRIMLTAMLGPRYPAWPTHGEWIRGWQSASRLAPENPDAWYGLGDAYFHLGSLTGLDSGFVRAEAAFRRAVQLDSGFVAPLEHLVHLSVLKLDVSAARRWWSMYRVVDSTSDAAMFLRWRTAHAFGDSATVRAIESALDTLPGGLQYRIATWPMYDGVGVSAARRAAGLYLLQEEGTNEFTERVHRNVSANLGLWSEYWRTIRAIRRRGGLPEDVPGDRAYIMAMWDGELAAGDSILTAISDGRLRATGWRPGCYPGMMRWLAAAGWRGPRFPESCIPDADRIGPRLLGEIAAAAGDPSRNLDSLLGLLDAEALNQTGAGGTNVWSLFAGTALVQRGEFARARDRFRRREVGAGDESSYLASLVRREGLAAELAGDTAGAIRAYRHYLWLRYDAEAGSRPWVDTVRVALRRLQR